MWKLLYIHLLGYDVEVGHMEALQLIAAPKFTEKQAVSSRYRPFSCRRS